MRESMCPLANKIRGQSKHGLCEHVLADKLTSSFACRAGRFCCSVIRVPPSARSA